MVNMHSAYKFNTTKNIIDRWNVYCKLSVILFLIYTYSTA